MGASSKLRTMDSSSLRTLNLISSPLNLFRSKTFPFSSFSLQHIKKHYLSLFSYPFHPTTTTTRQCSCSSKSATVRSLPYGAEAITESRHSKLLQVVLVSPQIPGNVGSIARTCAASAVGLHLVEPLGFQVDDTKLKRAGLDYWPYVVVKIHGSWAEFRDYFGQQVGENRLLALTKRGTSVHSDFSYRRGDWLVFGAETFGLSSEVLADCTSETFGGGTIRIPMVDTYVRCLNLSVSVGIALYEASRQLNYEQLQHSSEDCIHDQEPFIAEDIYV